MGDLLFVYGTLRKGSGHPMAAWLVARAEWLGPATVAGCLYRVSYYPGLVAGEGRVSGDLFRLHGEGLAETWAGLDAFEDIHGEADDEYRREATRVRLVDGRELEAEAYWYRRSTDGLSPVPGGDWLQES